MDLTTHESTDGVASSNPPNSDDRLSPPTDADERHLTEQSDALRRATGDTDTAVIPVVAEELQVRRRAVETGRVRLRKLVREEQEVVDQPTLHEEVTVERVPINQFVEHAPAPRQEGDTVVFPVLEEVLVVQRRLMLKEEVRVTKRVTETREPEAVTLRSEEVKIERIQDRSEGMGT
jgi:uncharacterized protein (TIGR02271 family)